MLDPIPNQIDAIRANDQALQKPFSGFRRRFPLSIRLLLFGIVACIASLALISNAYGNTDTLGLILFGFSVWILVAGIGHFFIQFRYAFLLGLIATPFLITLLFVLFWVSYVLTGLQYKYHQEFAANGVEQIQHSKQMDELYDDCRHYITYGEYNVALFNSVAYFGDRYRLKMQVPVRIYSSTSGKIIGEPTFYLNETSEIDVSETGQVGASFSDGIEFNAADWKRVYESAGDFSTIGFSIDPTPVPNFKAYSDASRQSN